MRTHCIVGVIDENQEDWRGRYVDWGGYPTGAGLGVYVIVMRDGIRQAIKTLTEENQYWSMVSYVPDGDWSAEADDITELPGYGMTAPDRERDYISSENPYSSYGCFWAYIIAPEGLRFYELRSAVWVQVLLLPWGMDLGDVLTTLVDFEKVLEDETN